MNVYYIHSSCPAIVAALYFQKSMCSKCIKTHKRMHMCAVIPMATSSSICFICYFAWTCLPRWTHLKNRSWKWNISVSRYYDLSVLKTLQSKIFKLLRLIGKCVMVTWWYHYDRLIWDSRLLLLQLLFFVVIEPLWDSFSESESS